MKMVKLTKMTDIYEIFDKLVETGYEENVNNLDFCIPTEPKRTVTYTRGSYKCVHKNLKTECDICNNPCKHGKIKRECAACRYRLCKHNVPGFRCKICKGTSICKHDKQRYNCYHCCSNPDEYYCKSENCFKRSTKKWDGYCKSCYDK